MASNDSVRVSGRVDPKVVERIEKILAQPDHPLRRLGIKNMNRAIEHGLWLVVEKAEAAS